MLSNNGTVIMRIAIFLLSVLCLGGASLPAQSAVFGSQGCGEVACDGMGSNYDLATKANACASSAFNLSGQIFDDRSLDSGGCLQVKGSYSSPAQNTTTTQSALHKKTLIKCLITGPTPMTVITPLHRMHRPVVVLACAHNVA